MSKHGDSETNASLATHKSQLRLVFQLRYLDFITCGSNLDEELSGTQMYIYYRPEDYIHLCNVMGDVVTRHL